MKTAIVVGVCLAAYGWAQTPALNYLNHGRPLLDAHNCYPYEGRFADRIDRALSTGFPVAIEQDIAWADGRPVVSHTDKTKGGEPALRDHFFERVRPIVEKALAEDRRDQWPVIVVHFDFKSNDLPLLRAVWALLGEYQGWITTATKGADDHELAPFEPKPLLVLTEDNDAQERVFFGELKAGAKLRLFGSAHTAPLPGNPAREERNRLAVTLPPEKLLTERPTNYRRWWNNSWFVVEEGGQREAGDWTAADDRRLRALVDHAHKLGYWIRFYTLDGFSKTEDQGWGDSYNFGSHEAVMQRWKAAVAAGVDLIASDQYEELRSVVAR